MAKRKPQATASIPRETRVGIGIDAGLKGAIAVLDERGELLDWMKMPVRDDARGRNTIDAKALWLLLAPWEERALFVATEAQHSFGTEARSRLWRYALGCGRMEATAELCLPDAPLVDFSPQAWKTAILGNVSASKADAVAWARGRWPGAGLPASDGPSEAAAQAAYGWTLRQWIPPVEVA